MTVPHSFGGQPMTPAGTPPINTRLCSSSSNSTFLPMVGLGAPPKGFLGGAI